MIVFFLNVEILKINNLENVSELPNFSIFEYNDLRIIILVSFI